MSVDWTKPIQTRGGRKARLVCTIPPVGGAETRVVTLDEQSLRLYYEAGNYIRDDRDNDDIINVPPRKETREVVAWAAVDHAGRVLYHGDLSIAETVMSQRKTAQLVRLTGTYEAEVAE
jgi:hypothetical protein